MGSTPVAQKIFLTAEWRDLVMLNYELDPRLLGRYVPVGTTLDSFLGKTYISLVGFCFRGTRLFGSVRIPLHSDFEEVNLRFYVRREVRGEIRRGVVFIAEIVPRLAVAAIARALYGEKYVCAPMEHQLSTEGAARSVSYKWRRNRQVCELSAQAKDSARVPPEGSLEQFITEHYWGYSAQRDGGTVEYHVAHPPWRVWTARQAGFQGDASSWYGPELGRIVQGSASSAFIAEGSPVMVFKGKRMS